jgi:hypothetical protein
MVTIYCRAHHGTGRELCPLCTAFLRYADKRLEKCPLQAAKPTCADCRIHCYQPARREEARRIMRYSGPRMIYRHPILALFHLLDGLRRGRAKQPGRMQGGSRRPRLP